MLTEESIALNAFVAYQNLLELSDFSLSTVRGNLISVSNS